MEYFQSYNGSHCNHMQCVRCQNYVNSYNVLQERCKNLIVEVERKEVELHGLYRGLAFYAKELKSCNEEKKLNAKRA